jgi:tetratricopeptide (TPR) repeat protein
MVLEPQRRYPTPRSLADDIERWMADEAVSAYREAFRARLARWERRHKALVHGGIGVLVIAVIGLAVAWTTVSHETQATELAIATAERNTMSVQVYLERSIDSVFFSTQVADREFSRIPGMESARQQLVEQAVREFEYFLKSRADDPELVRKAQEGYRNAGLVRWESGDFARAKQAYASALEILEKLPSIAPFPEPLDRLKMAVANREMANFLQNNGHDQEAESYFDKALSVTDDLFAKHSEMLPYTQKELRKETGRLSFEVGDAQHERGDLEQAGRFYRRAIELLAPVIEEPREWYSYRLLVGAAHRGLGMIARERKGKSAGQEFAEAERIARSVLKDASESDPRSELALTLVIRWDQPAAAPGDAAEADAALDEAVALFDSNIKEFPANVWHCRDRALALLARAGRHADWGHADRAERDLSEAQRSFTELMAKESENWSYPGHRGRVEVALARLRLRQGRAGEAHKLMKQGIADLELACEHRPHHVGNRRSLDEAHQLDGSAVFPHAGEGRPRSIQFVLTAGRAVREI